MTAMSVRTSRVLPLVVLALACLAVAAEEPNGVTVHTFATDSVSVDLQISWTAVLDRRGNPISAYNVEVKDVPSDNVITGSTVPGTQLVDTLTVSRPAPGDSLLFYVRVRAVDDRGVQGQWGQSGTFKITNPDLLGPPAPGVSIDTLGLLVLDSLTVFSYAALLDPDGSGAYLIAPNDTMRWAWALWSGSAIVECGDVLPTDLTHPCDEITVIGMADPRRSRRLARGFYVGDAVAVADR